MVKVCACAIRPPDNAHRHTTSSLAFPNRKLLCGYRNVIHSAGRIQLLLSDRGDALDRLSTRFWAEPTQVSRATLVSGRERPPVTIKRRIFVLTVPRRITLRNLTFPWHEYG